MPIYRIEGYVEMFREVEIEASSYEEAEEKAHSCLCDTTIPSVYEDVFDAEVTDIFAITK